MSHFSTEGVEVGSSCSKGLRDSNAPSSLRNTQGNKKLLEEEAQVQWDLTPEGRGREHSQASLET